MFSLFSRSRGIALEPITTAPTKKSKMPLNKLAGVCVLTFTVIIVFTHLIIIQDEDRTGISVDGKYMAGMVRKMAEERQYVTEPELP
ncbi:hypothetical protein IAT40_002854 [Kwoniella sp. CBS 6097]